MTCERCGRDLHAPEEPLLCDGCDYPEGMCTCKELEPEKIIGPPAEEERKPLQPSPFDRKLDQMEKT